MPRAEVGSIKWLANKMRAKGLQRLKWYCQMCEKQCRDENGFRCHMVSEGHARQMQVFQQKPGRFMDEFSRSFESEFMRYMRTKYCRARVLANSVYCEVIANKRHIHMNSTVWVTLSQFVRYLGASGKCKVEETPRGLYLTYIDQERDIRERLAREGEQAETLAEAIDVSRMRKAIREASAEREATLKELEEKQKATRVAPTGKIGEVKLSFSAPAVQSKKIGEAAIAKSLFMEAPKSVPPLGATKRPSSMLDMLLPSKRNGGESIESEDLTFTNRSSGIPEPAEDIVRHPLEDSDEWLGTDLIVEIAKPGWEFDGRKGTVDGLEKDGTIALVSLFGKPKRILRVDRQFLATVIPKPGRWARVILGTYRGHEGRITAADADSERVSLLLHTGPHWGDLPPDILTPEQKEKYRKYLKRLKKVMQQEIVVIERGELPVEDLPFDAVCKCIPPEEYEELDEAFDFPPASTSDEKLIFSSAPGELSSSETDNDREPKSDLKFEGTTES